MIRHAVCLCTGFALLSLAADLRADAPPPIQVTEDADAVRIETDALKATLPKRGYVSGVKAGTLIDKKTGAHDLGFGLHIMDFLLAPGWADDEYGREKKYHGNLPKHLVEGPQICTQAKELPLEVIRGKDFVAVKTHWTFTKAAKGLKAGSRWEQTLVFKPGIRYFFSAERITSVNDVDDLFYRIDMPGHIRHKDGDTFEQVYLSYHGLIPATEFAKDFAPDERFLYKRQGEKIPERMIRGYQIKLNGKPGPWLAGMTLDPAECCEAWCHQRGYVCFIEELHRKKVKAGETFGAAYVVGFFDDVKEMEKVYDEYRSKKNIPVTRIRLSVGGVRTFQLFAEDNVTKAFNKTIVNTNENAVLAMTPINPTVAQFIGRKPGRSSVIFLDVEGFERDFEITVVNDFRGWSPLPEIGEPLPGTIRLARSRDPALEMVEGIDSYLNETSERSPETRIDSWKLGEIHWMDAKRFDRSVAAHLPRFKHILGIAEPREKCPGPEYVSAPGQPALVAQTPEYKVFAVSWPVFDGVEGDGLLIEPNVPARACVIAIPDSFWFPEQLVGLAPGIQPWGQIARICAENRCRVLVPAVIDREVRWSGNVRINRQPTQSHREFLYRMSYELGRHIIGYEVQKVQAALDWIAGGSPELPVHVCGHGEGGLVAWATAAVDRRVQTLGVSGYHWPRHKLWDSPLDRNVWALLTEFGDDEVVYLGGSRVTAIEATDVRLLDVGLAGEGKRQRPTVDDTKDLSDWFPKLGAKRHRDIPIGGGMGGYIRQYDDPQYERSSPAEHPVSPVPTLKTFLEDIISGPIVGVEGSPVRDFRNDFDPSNRQHRQFTQLVDYTQKLMRDAERRRAEFWSKVKLPAKPDAETLAKWQADCKPYRDYFWEEVIGKLPPATLPMNPKSRQVYDEPKWKGYEVTLDLYPDVFAYGILLLPKDLNPGEKRPVVVCQHGLEGRPTDVVNPKERTKFYNSFGARLADLGYIVYAPQNPYIGGDTFRMLQRKANPLKLSIFSFIVRQHERTLDWLCTLPNVDPDKIAFYGLSYGGKTAMRVPAILPKYCLSICSGDFNEWTWKNCSVDFPASYMFSGEWEMPEFDIGNTFGYAEMANLIAPRPFMVERGHDDGVGVDEWVAYEYAKVRRTYDKLGIGDRTEIEFFNGGHECHCEGTFAFLKKHLKWPR